MKVFNTTGLCLPQKHYMVDITERVLQIKAMVDNGDYFTINRARQYGKTTTLAALETNLSNEYTVLRLDFQAIGKADFADEESFVKTLSRIIIKKAKNTAMPKKVEQSFEDFAARTVERARFNELFDLISRWCEQTEKPIVLMIDEIDSASNNDVFLDFLAQIRLMYLERYNSPAFQSVILAGVTDIRHLKSKLRDDEQAKVNSPWNIATDFRVDMSLSSEGIKGMLDDYEGDHKTGMNTARAAQLIHDYTSGYPFLVSRICQIVDTQLVPDKFGSLSDAWTKDGLLAAIKIVLAEKNTLFQSLIGKIINSNYLKTIIKRILIEGASIPYNADNEDLDILSMYGFIKENNSRVCISNRIFETRLYNYLCSVEETGESSFSNESELAKNIFIKNGKLDMCLIMEHFIKTYTQIFGTLEERFKEKDGRELFLLYLRPIINGTGNYYIEAQTRDMTRMDIVVDYLGEQYVIELKIWRGEKYNTDGEQQLSEYLEHLNLNVGYMLTFNFTRSKEQGVKRVTVGDKVIFEATL